MSGQLHVLITGANGQLGRTLLRFSSSKVNITAATHSQLDIGDVDSVRQVIDFVKPDVVINTAAFNAVDDAETEIATALRANAVGPANIATELKKIGHGRLIQISTDFVFDGNAERPYVVDAECCPVNMYGRTKYKGECAVRELLGDRALIFRTAWLYSSSGRNFLVTMLHQMRARGEVRVVNDQIGTPTSANSLARVLWKVALHSELSGIHHWTDAGSASRYDFAVAIAEEAMALGLVEKFPKVLPIATADYPTPARRPAYSVLDKSRSYLELQLEPVHWRVELRKVLGELVNA